MAQDALTANTETAPAAVSIDAGPPQEAVSAPAIVPEPSKQRQARYRQMKL